MGRKGSALGLLHTHTHTHTRTCACAHTHTHVMLCDCKDLKTPFILIKGNSKRHKGKREANTAVINLRVVPGLLTVLSAAGTWAENRAASLPVLPHQGCISRQSKPVLLHQGKLGA